MIVLDWVHCHERLYPCDVSSRYWSVSPVWYALGLVCAVGVVWSGGSWFEEMCWV